jgi:AraC-like DNA-binding protein
MEPSIDLLGVITLLGASQGVLLALALLGLRQGNRSANRLLALFMACSSVIIIGSLLNSTKYVLAYPHLTQVVTPFHFLFGPLFFFYVSVSTSSVKRSFQKRDLLHFIPAALCLAYYLPFYLQGREAKIAYTISAFENYPPLEWRVRTLLIGLQCIPYMVLMYAKVLSLSRNSREPLSSAKRNNLFWLRTFMTMILVAAVAGLFRVALNFRAESILLMPICFTVIVYVAGYMAIKHPEALAGVEEENLADSIETSNPTKKYEKSNLTPERAEEYLKRLIHFMESEKPYTDGDLTLQKLAEKLSIPINHLSQIINERLRQNFFDFVNSYRVKEVQRMMSDPSKKHYSLIAIAEEVGFNSKSTFNSVFKKHVNMTPSEYRKISASL